MASWQDYLKLLRNLSKTLGQLTQVERDKNAAAAAGDLAGVEEDQKRDAMLAALGLKGVTLRELANHSPEELRLEVKGVAEELRRQYEIFQSASKAARNTLELNLRAIERVQAVRAGDAAQAEEQRKNHQTDFRA